MKKLLLICISFKSIGFCAFLQDIPINLHQPDGTMISCFSSGDEYYVRLHDENDYTIMQNADDGYYYYVQQVKNEVIPTSYRADHPIPLSANFQSGIHISKSDYLKRRENKSQSRGRDAPTIGTINNINIFIRFADEE